MPNSPLHPHPLSPLLVLAANEGPIWLCHCKPKLPFFVFASRAQQKGLGRDTWGIAKAIHGEHVRGNEVMSREGSLHQSAASGIYALVLAQVGEKRAIHWFVFVFIYQFLPMLFVLLGPLRKGKLQYTTLMKGKKYVYVFCCLFLSFFFSTVYFEHFCLMFNTCSCWKKESFLVKYLYYIYGSLKQKKGWFILVCIFLLLY